MNMANLRQRRTRLAATLLAVALSVCACAERNEPATADQAATKPAAVIADAAAPSPASTANAAAETEVAVDETAPVDRSNAPVDASDSAEPQRVTNIGGEPSLSCRTDADCAIKDVGSCCGYNPRCVNKDSQTFPEQVQAKCANDGRVGICGFPSISGCECVAGKCAGIPGADGNEVVR